MNKACELCGGACCEAVLFWRKQVPDRMWHWLKLHGQELKESDGVVLPCKCRELGWEGKCRIYDERPQTCRDFPVGGLSCRMAIELRRGHMPHDKGAILEALNHPEPEDQKQ